MPKTAPTPREVIAPPELVAAADVALDSNMHPKEATDLLRYLIITRKISRCGGNQTQAALSMGMTRSAMNQAVAMLQSRLT